MSTFRRVQYATTLQMQLGNWQALFGQWRRATKGYVPAHISAGTYKCRLVGVSKTALLGKRREGPGTSRSKASNMPTLLADTHMCRPHSDLPAESVIERLSFIMIDASKGLPWLRYFPSPPRTSRRRRQSMRRRGRRHTGDCFRTSSTTQSRRDLPRKSLAGSPACARSWRRSMEGSSAISHGRIAAARTSASTARRGRQPLCPPGVPGPRRRPRTP